MSSVVEDPEVAKALEELHQYLSDQLPPLMVADSMEVLLHQPPNLVASGIHSWVAGLTRRDTNIPLSDFLYHAMTKIYQVQEYKLIAADQFAPFLAALKQAILAYCPPEDQAFLKKNLELLGKGTTVSSSSSVGVVVRPGGGSAPEKSAPAPVDPAKEKEAHRFGYLMNRLAKRLTGFMTGAPDAASQPMAAGSAGGSVPVPVMPKEQIVTEALADAARTTKEPSELNKVLDHLRNLGVQAGPDDLFRALGRSLPGWNIEEKPNVQLPENSNLQAMHRIISKAPNIQDGANHFRHLIKAAVERFNEGFLPQASSMFDLANKMVAAKEVDVIAVELQITKGHEQLDEDRLRKYADTPEMYSLLRKVLNFFPAMNTQGLMEAIYDCQKRERRKLLLTLLECQGEPARAACLEYLKKPMPKDVADIELWYRRNLIYLLRRIPAPPNELMEQTVDTVLMYIDLRLIPMLIKEALNYLPQLRHEKVEQALKRMLQQLEGMVANPQTALHEPKEINQILDRVISTLCRLGTQSARRAVLDHALKKKPDNEAIVRLAELAQSDLSEDQQTLDRLLEAIQANVPIKRLGIVLPQKDYTVKWLATSLGGTPHPQAKAALEDLAQRYPECESGKAAMAALTKQEQAKTAKRTDTRGASLMGDLDVFSLPGLLQSLSDSTVTGTLTIKNTKGDFVGSITLIRGRLRDAKCGMLTSEAAFYQLFEKPQPGTFQFVRALEPTAGSESEYPEMMGLMLEGLRRYDEVQQMRATVPDEVKLKVKAVKPSLLPGEKDGLLFRDLWTAVQNGATAVQCESTIALDCYRVRRLLSHWMESGVIEMA